MKFALIIFMPIVGLFFCAAEVQAALPITSQQEYLSPAEPQSVLRSSVVPCFNQEQTAAQDGIGRRMNLARIEGEQCSPRVSSPSLPDRPGHEANPANKDFQKRAL